MRIETVTGKGYEKKIMHMECADSISNPASTKHRIFGPGIVTQTTYDDGGIHTLEEDATPDLFCNKDDCGTCNPECKHCYGLRSKHSNVVTHKFEAI